MNNERIQLYVFRKNELRKLSLYEKMTMNENSSAHDLTIKSTRFKIQVSFSNKTNDYILKHKFTY